MSQIFVVVADVMNSLVNKNLGIHPKKWLVYFDNYPQYCPCPPRTCFSRSGRPCWLGWTELKSGRRNQVSCQLNILNASIRSIGRARHHFEISNQMQFLFRRPWAWWHTNFNTCWRNYEQVLMVFLSFVSCYYSYVSILYTCYASTLFDESWS